MPFALRLLLCAALVACSGCRSRAAPSASLSNVHLVDAAQGPQVHLELALHQLPRGDVQKFYVLIGCELCEGGNRYVQWDELMERDGDPATTAATPPTVGQRISVDVPLKLLPSLKTARKTSNSIFNVVVTLFWGTTDEGTIDQSKAEFSLEAFYKKT